MIANGSPLASVVAGSCSSLSSFVCDSRCLAAAATSILRPRIQPVSGGASTCATKRNYVAIPKIPAAAHFLDSVAHFSETMAGKTPSCSSSSMNKKGSPVLQACCAGKLRDWGRSSATRCIAGRISFCGGHPGRGTQTPSSQNSKRWQSTMNCTTVLDSDSLCEDGRHQATPSTSQHHATWSSFSRQGVHYKFPAAPQGPSLHPSISTTDVRRGCATSRFTTSSVPRAGARRAPHPHHAHQVRYLTHYQRLGIEPPSNPGEIKRAYFAKAKECHPDIHGDAKTKEFQELSAAYAVLSDERKKASYDASGYQDRNYDAPSDPNRGPHGYQSDIPDLDAAFAMFRQVFSEYGFQMYYDTLQQDVQNTYERAVATQSYEPFYDLANRRKGLVFGIVVPALLLFRFPWLALAATRMLGSVGMFLFQVIARNPRLQAAVAAWLWKRIVEFSARMSRDDEKSSSTEDARKTGGRKTKR